MKSLFLLAAPALLSLLPFVIAGARDDPFVDAYPRFPYQEASSPRGDYWVPNGDMPWGKDEGAVDPRGRASRIPDSYRLQAPGGYLQPAWRDAYGRYGFSGQEPMGSSELDYGRQREASRSDAAYGAPGPPGDWGLPRRSHPEYRFRGDQQLPAGRFGGAPSQGGYRFRPLTEQERERMGYDSGRRPGWTGRDSYHGDHPDGYSAKEAYGYEPDNWFRRNYGDRPNGPAMIDRSIRRDPGPR